MVLPGPVHKVSLNVGTQHPGLQALGHKKEPVFWSEVTSCSLIWELVLKHLGAGQVTEAQEGVGASLPKLSGWMEFAGHGLLLILHHLAHCTSDSGPH